MGGIGTSLMELVIFMFGMRVNHAFNHDLVPALCPYLNKGLGVCEIPAGRAKSNSRRQNEV